jgi:predicted O-methyltransferase YrrM
MDESLRLVVDTLEQIHEVGLVWPTGLINPGGPHRRLRGHLHPISIGEDECLAFGKLIEAFRPQHCYIIGNAFGLSSVYIANVMKRCGGKSVITLDNQCEGSGEKTAKIAQRLAEGAGVADILKNKKGSSPEDISSSVEQPSYDLIFIDGMHQEPHATHDFEGMLPYAHPRSVIAFHDSWIPGVPAAAQRAKEKGFRNLWLRTSCEMIVSTRDPEDFKRLQALFPEGVEDKGPATTYWQGFFLHTKEILSFYAKKALGRA